MKTAAATLLALALLAPDGAAQLSEQQAGKQLRALAQQVRKDHGAAVKGHLAVLDAAVDAFVVAVESGGGGVGEPFDDLFEALVGFQQDLYSEFLFGYAVLVNDTDGAQVLLDAYAGGAPLAGVYPEDFYFGIGRALDDMRAGMLAQQAKALAKARKLLEKAAARLAKAGNARMAFFVEAATIDGQYFFKQGSSGGQTRDPLVLHTVLTLGFVDSAESGTLLAAGLGQDGADPITVRAIGEGPLENVGVTFPGPGSPFWTVRIDNDLAGMADGNYYVVAWQGTYATSQGAQVSIR